MDNVGADAVADPGTERDPANTSQGPLARGGSGRWGSRGPAGADVTAGVIVALFSVPEGMAFAAIAGLDPAAGLYSGVVPAVVGSLLAGTPLMVTTLTSAIALSSQEALGNARLDPSDPRNLAALTLLVGLAMAVFALVRLGAVFRAVSVPVMTGFSLGIAVQIVAGALADATGFRSTHHNTLVRIADGLAHAGAWDRGVVTAAMATVAVWAVVHASRRWRPWAVLVALVTVSAMVAAWRVPLPLASSLGPVPTGLPDVTLPDWSVLPALVPGACAVAVVALAQAAGIPSVVPVGEVTSGRKAWRADLPAQAAANLAGAFFRALPAGGSLSRTGVALAAGARTRWVGVVSGVVLAVLVCAMGRAIGRIPLAVVGGLIVVVGAKLIVGRSADVRRAWRSGPIGVTTLLLTFLATTQIALHYAIAAGVLLSLAPRAMAAVRGRVRWGRGPAGEAP
ncbi:hypothetical protein GCM10010289_44340 [Streptomyces violascens]|uniref:SLC26A/SulP transporter domain-containing protein n=1 Tax=Streptomyces violascens TaxID=67381 RepID=A0ABQ3QXL7_9ACTN|nr:hypothetical protein GCM10010289_44340 [Streptomyces violascens]GHI42026.1 hypothetical protein Sviol_64340 [Streptomyces violascens]